jgi:hypothetical protein
MTRFHSSLWLNNIPPCTYMCTEIEKSSLKFTKKHKNCE